MKTAIKLLTLTALLSLAACQHKEVGPGHEGEHLGCEHAAMHEGHEAHHCGCGDKCDCGGAKECATEKKCGCSDKK